jgi:hypothetical protein
MIEMQHEMMGNEQIDDIPIHVPRVSTAPDDHETRIAMQKSNNDAQKN